MPKSPLARMAIYGAVASAILLAISLSIDWFPKSGSATSDDIDTLYDVLLIVSVPIFVLVMTVAIYSVVKFRARPGDMGDGEPIHGNARLEVVWVVIPFLLVAGLAAYAWITLHNIEKKKKGEMVVHVTAQQFAWSYRYAGPGGKQITSDVLYLPVKKPVKFEIQSKDVIHSFWVPDFRLKSDAVPGLTTTWRTTPTALGIHDVVCTELCGAGHSLMRSTVRVVSDGAFTAWLSKQAGSATASTGGGAPSPGGAGAAKPGAAAADGKQVFAANGCSGCHTLAAAGATGKVGPDLDSVVADAKKYFKAGPPAAYIKQSIVNPNAFVVPGFPKGTMPQTFQQQLSPQQLDALVQFLLKSGGKAK
ncbi:MAG: cytochrome c oxidase subunit [Solirubrobacteraceae bacterium]|nr:cytochrome c oxidase subunit [Solirubrobacteraceae bacterium]